jgi:cellulose synthase/poly-beta-1,6-N-acetylglucosamine synthase-like glycosyltransferase
MDAEICRLESVGRASGYALHGGLKMALILIWISLAFLLYVHVGYPLVLLAWRRLAPRPVKKGFGEPSVSILIAARNEKDRIEAKIMNCLQLDYPPGKLQVVVALDAPSDGTDQIARKCESAIVNVLSCSQHQGKAGTLNDAAASARGDILVFADVRQQFDRHSLRELVANFHDPSIGAVSGELILMDENGHEAADGVGLYWRYEKWIRAQEAEIHSMMGATGSIYAIRRELYTPMPPDTILDDVAIPMNIVLRGKRAVFDGSARAYDQVSASPKLEYGRKVRTLTGNYQVLARMPALLSPLHNPVWLQFISHKVGRLLVPYFLALLFVANLFALRGIYLWLFYLQGAWYMMAWAGSRLSLRTPVRDAAGTVAAGREVRRP